MLILWNYHGLVVRRPPWFFVRIVLVSFSLFSVLRSIPRSFSSFDRNSAVYDYYGDLSLVRQQQPRDDDDEQKAAAPRIFVVHIGKTGGETLRRSLRIDCRIKTANMRNNNNNNNNKKQTKYDRCLQNLLAGGTAADESALSRHATGVLHVHDVWWPSSLADATHLLFTVRHPVRRLWSWYRYTVPASCDPATAPRACRTRRDAAAGGFAAAFFGCFPRQADLFRGLQRAATLPVGTWMTDNNVTINDDDDNDGDGDNDDDNDDGNNDETTDATTTARKCTHMLLDTLRGNLTGLGAAGHMQANYAHHVDVTLGLTTTTAAAAGGGDRRVVQPQAPRLPKRLVATKKLVQEQRRRNGDNITIWVTRTEHMWEDIPRMDVLLGGTGVMAQAGLHVSHYKGNRHKDATSATSSNSNNQTAAAVVDGSPVAPPLPPPLPLAADWAPFVCCIMHQEMALYKELVERASNLLDAQRQATLQEALHVCGVPSWPSLLQACHDNQWLSTHEYETSLLHRPAFSP